MYNPYQQSHHTEHVVMMVAVLLIILASVIALPLIVAPAIAVGSSNIAGGVTGTTAVIGNSISNAISKILPFGCAIM